MMSVSPHLDHTRSSAGTSISTTSGPLIVPPLLVHVPVVVPYALNQYHVSREETHRGADEALTVLAGWEVQKLVK